MVSAQATPDTEEPTIDWCSDPEADNDESHPPTFTDDTDTIYEDDDESED